MLGPLSSTPLSIVAAAPNARALTRVSAPVIPAVVLLSMTLTVAEPPTDAVPLPMKAPAAPLI